MRYEQGKKVSECRRIPWLALCALALAGLCVGLLFSPAASAEPPLQTDLAQEEQYAVLAWNDLGMHCYNPSFQDIGVLPPWNTLWAQVVRVGDPPVIVTQGLTVTWHFEDNTYSVGKTDFWDTSPYTPAQNAQILFNLAEPLPPDVGLAGNGLAGHMEPQADYFVAEGIPLTEYRDSAPGDPYPYMLATIVVQDAASGQELARTQPVAPVSTEMHCEYCHADNGPGNSEIATGVVEQNILTLHDEENMGEYPPGQQGALMDRRPVLCAGCHQSNALPTIPGEPSVPNMSEALHGKHAELDPQLRPDCYDCHPGPQTQCLRGVMSSQYGMECEDCHGTLQVVANNPNPWLNEPRCDDPACHGSAYAQDQPLYRFSREHGGIYCEACHDSTHAIAPSVQANDAVKFYGWQHHNGPLDRCWVCHATWPADQGPHGMVSQPPRQFYLPLILRAEP
jgi:hypothetical protein